MSTGRGPLKMSIAVTKSDFPLWMKNVPAAVQEALHQEANDIWTISQYLVPVASGNLKNSGQVILDPKPNGSEDILIAYGGPSINYALPVHDRPATHAAPTSWKFLEIPFDSARQGMVPRITERVRRALGGGAGGGISADSGGMDTGVSAPQIGDVAK